MDLLLDGCKTRVGLNMAGQLLPPPGFDAPLPESLTPQQRIAAWIDVMNTAETFLIAGLKKDVGPKGDVRAAYRTWYESTMFDHDRMMRRLVDEFNRRSNGNAG